ncbi:hypothetical protein CRE_00507 [Caenorhabditis remanei]|uniref:Uncharacterized protein n=1 Tax=Caenorhabditis remanei TaxID=31234 RepID=E3LCK4_CAERE|nr:hypothetical protein CRE_00507 [Caenorhabditis remanei]
MNNNDSNLSGLSSLEKFFRESSYSPNLILLCESCLKPGRKMHTNLCQGCFDHWVYLRSFPPIEKKSAVKKCALCDSTFSFNYKRISFGNVCRPCYRMKEEAGELPNKKPKKDIPAKEPEQNCYHRCIKCSNTFTGSDVLDIVLCPDCHASENSTASKTSEVIQKPDVEATQTTHADESVVANQYDGTSTCNVSPLQQASTPTVDLPNRVVEKADQSHMQFYSTNNGQAIPAYNNTYPIFDLDPNMHADFGSSPPMHPDFGSTPNMHPGFGLGPNTHPAFGSGANMHLNLNSSSNMKTDTSSSSSIYSESGLSPIMHSGFGSSPSIHSGSGSSPNMYPNLVSSPDMYSVFGSSPHMHPSFGSSPDVHPDFVSTSNMHPDLVSNPNMLQYHYQADQAQWDTWNFNDQFSYSNYPCHNF